MKYYNSEMAECAPTIQMFEILEGFRREGLGSRFLEYIEEDVLDNGFFKIWASETKTNDFWRYHGYDIDIDEGEKYL